MRSILTRFSWLSCAVALGLVGLWLLLFWARPVYAQHGEQEIEPARLAAISPHLEAQLSAASAPVSFLVILNEQVDAAEITQAAELRAADGRTRGQAIYAQLTEAAQQSQAPLRAWLDAQGVAYRPFYIVNMIEVQGDAALADALRRRPEVNRLAANPRVDARQALAAPLSPNGWLTELDLPEAESIPSTLYGLNFTRAPAVWEMGFRGQGIVVASQDTGVQWDHPALRTHYRGWEPSTGDASHLYNWFDAWDNDNPADRCDDDPQIPCDDNGHGTHTVGTMVGDASADGGEQLGMAPDARWIGCRNMLNGIGSPASYAACFEFFLAPYPQHGDKFLDGKPEFAPHIINNSWACPPSEGCDAESLRQVVETVRAAGQFVVSSAGNEGPGCSTVRNPIALYDAAFSVGAHDSSGTIAFFSSRGPVTADGSNRLKPEITAPGVSVYSSYRNSTYTTLSGTSMAAPHVAGAVALLWSAVPTLTGQIDLTEQVLIKSATPVSDDRCGESGSAIPNNTYGFGRLDVLAAVEMAQRPASLVVTVADATAAPLEDVQVDLVDLMTGYRFQSQTGADGKAEFDLFYRGDYILEFRKPDVTIPARSISVQPGDRLLVEVQAGEVAEQEFELIFPLILFESQMP